jgi:hypothetical protein
MRPWKTDVAEPFASNDDFWRSVGSSVDASLTLVVTVVLAAAFGPVAAIAFVLPIALLMYAALTGRRSAAQTRGRFATHDEWRDAERRAVASVLPRAYARPRWGRRAA